LPERGPNRDRQWHCVSALLMPSRRMMGADRTFSLYQSPRKKPSSHGSAKRRLDRGSMPVAVLCLLTMSAMSA
jgi:hypothetical protein